MAEQRSEIWVIYEHPSDHPDSFVARRHVVQHGAVLVATSEFMTAPTLDKLRNEFIDQGLTCTPRHVDDDPMIVERWK